MTCNVEFLAVVSLAICVSSLVTSLHLFPHCYVTNFTFQRNFRVTAKLSGSCRHLCRHSASVHDNLPCYQYPPSEHHICYSHTYINTSLSPKKSIMYIWTHSWYYATSVCWHGWLRMYIHHYIIIHSIFTALNDYSSFLPSCKSLATTYLTSRKRKGSHSIMFYSQDPHGL